MREIPLTQGMVALVDEDDYEEVSRYRWHAVLNRGKRTWYAQRTTPLGSGKETTVKMHVAIMGKAPDGYSVDHRNGNGLDNRRSNLRWATLSQQMMNTRVRRDSQEGLKGVQRRYKRDGTIRAYRARIQINGQTWRIGDFSTAEAAAKAYDNKAREVYGDFARLNFDDSE